MSGYSITKIGALGVVEQTDWGVANIGAPVMGPTLFTDTIECELPSVTLAGEAISMEACLRGNFHEPTITAGSNEGSTLSFSTYLHGWLPTGTSIAGAPDPTPISKLLKSAMGSSTQVIPVALPGTWVTGGAWTGAGVITGDADDGPYGSPVSIDIGGGDRYNVWLKDKTSATNFIPFPQPAATAPAAVPLATYGSNTVYLSTAQIDAPLTVEWRGSDSTNRIRFFDGVVTSAKITINPKEVATLDVEMKFGGFQLDGAGGTVPQYAYPRPVVAPAMLVNNARLLINGEAQNDPSVATQMTNFTTFEFTVEAEHLTALSHNGEQGLSRYIIASRSMTLSATQPMHDSGTTATPIDLKTPGATLDPLQLDLNQNQPGNSMSFLLPKAVIKDATSFGDSDGVVGVTYSMGAHLYAGDDPTGGVPTEPPISDATLSPFRIAFL